MSSPSIIEAIRKIRSLLTRSEKIRWLGIVGFAVFTSAFEAATAFVIVIFAQVLNNPEVGQKYLSLLGMHDLSPNRTVFYIAIIVGATYLIKNSVAIMEVFYQSFSIQKMNYQFKNKLLHRYSQADYGFYLTRNSAIGMQVIAGDVEQMFSNAMVPLAGIISETIIFICLISMVIIMNPSLAIVIFVVSAFVGLCISKALPSFYRWGKRLQTASLLCHQHLMQFFHAFKEVVLFNKRAHFVNAYQRHSREKSLVHALHTATNSTPRMIIEILFVGLFVLTILFLCYKHESPIQMIGILGGYLYVGFRVMPGLNRIINQLNTFKSSIPAIESVYSECNSVQIQSINVNVPDFKFKHSIKLNNVGFKYLNTEKSSIKNISLEIKKGECVGIIGETGSGKSTLVDIILGLLVIQNGAVLVDDKYPVNCYQWQNNIGYVPQSIYLVDASIEANIAFGEANINVDRLNAAIDAAQLRKYIDQLPDGVKTLIGERGVRLSGGERQRIAIARALYRNPEILIFDEATSALDNETEARLMETIRAVSRNRTVIMIAHRLSTLKDCDLIIELENGSIKQMTTYQDMLQAGNTEHA